MLDGKLFIAIENFQRSPTDDRILDRAVRELAEHLYQNLRRFKVDCLTEDSRSDYIAWIYPRLANIVRQYDGKRSSFNTYITWVVRLSWRTFWRNQYSRDACQRVLETEAATTLLSVEADRSNAGEWIACTEDSGRSYGKTQQPTRNDMTERISAKKRQMEARKVFLLACKAGNFLDESSIEKIVDSTGYDEEYVRKTLATIQERCKKKRERIQTAREQQNACYVRAQKCLYEMKYLDRDSTRYCALEREYRYCVKRLERLRLLAARQIRSPSNRFIAATLGISRGTVDATLAAALQAEYPDES